MRVPLTGKESNKEVADKIADEIHRMLRSCEVKSLKGYGKDRETVVGGAQLIMDSHLWRNCPAPIDLEGAKKFLGDIYDNYQ
jgi:alcohol dehydrogenase class IV